MTDTIEAFATYMTKHDSIRTQELTLAYLERERRNGNRVIGEWPENFAGASYLLSRLKREARMVANCETVLSCEISTFSLLSATEIDCITTDGRIFTINTTERTAKEL